MRHSALRGCLIFTVFLGAFTYSDAKPQPAKQAPRVETNQNTPDRSDSHQSTKGDKQETAPPETRVDRIFVPTHDGESQGQLNNAKEIGTEFWPPLWGYRIKVSDSLLTFSTILLFFATLAVWWSTRNLVIGAEKAAKRQLRAYVFVAQVEIGDVGTDKVKASIVIRNTGQTPAYDVTVSTGANAFNVPGDVTFTPTPVGPDSSRFVFGPDGLGRRDIPLHSIIGEPNAVTAIKAGNAALYVWGEIIYQDTFGKTQHTRFRHMIGGRSCPRWWCNRLEQDRPRSALDIAP